MKILFRLIYNAHQFIKKGYNKAFLVPGMKASLGHCGENVRISHSNDVKGQENLYFYNDIQIGPYALLWSTRAKIIIKDYVLIGPNITIITGDHRIDIVGKHIHEVTDEEKLPQHDQDVVIEKGVWIGANVTVLKGVIIGEGAVVAAGSVVTKNVEPFGIYGGIPARKIGIRFSSDVLEEHKYQLERNKVTS
ncbi:acyltransferase [Actinomycetes bacterium NPDC127524]